ncbi:MAG TPA: hypothetical protein VFC99_04235 [Acidimicrobiia bacterium]|nr:hypothetical protein [Acidimicrobiia bacterium]
MNALVGVVGGAVARVAPDGRVRLDDAAWSLDWWIGADDRWHVPGRERAVRQSRRDDVPVVETAMRVPGGDARQRVYGAAPDLVVVEVENASPAPFVLALVVREAHDAACDGATVWIDGRPALRTARAPSRWAAGTANPAADTDGAVFDDVAGGRASDDPPPALRDRRGRLDVAWLHPVAHRTTFRAALVTGAPSASVDPARLPSPDAVARGWSAQLDRGMRIVLPDDHLAAAVRAARAELLLAAGARALSSRRRAAAGADLVAALEDWGFDAEAAAGWERLPGRARRRAARRRSEPARWGAVVRARAAGDGPAMLLALRSVLVHETGEDSLTICAELPAAWRGRDLEVHDAPTRRGPVSYAVRWHGPRPALLWQVPDGSRLRAPGLDPTWSASEARGETLLAAAEAPA